MARAHHGLDQSPAMVDVLAVVEHAVDRGLASFPLSAAHYVETYHGRDPQRRQRLGLFMARISRFDTIAGAPDVLEAEVDAAVGGLVGAAPTLHARVFGRGIAHALGVERAYLLNAPTRSRLMRALGEDGVFERFETASLVGPTEQLPHGDIKLPTREFSQRQLDHELDTAAKLREWGHSPDRAHRAVLAEEFIGVIDPVERARLRHGVPREALASRQAMTALLMAMPAKAAVTRLRMRAHENPSFAWHIGDLNDITALGTAAAYCDIVVAEKKWGSLLRRDSDQLRATVTSRLADLPALLVSFGIG